MKLTQTQISLLRYIFAGDQEAVDMLSSIMSIDDIMSVVEMADKMSIGFYEYRLEFLALPNLKELP